MTDKHPVVDFATDWDHTDPEWVNDPYPIWEDLRLRCPVAHTDRYGGAWFPASHAGVAKVAKDTDTFTSRAVVMGNGRPTEEDLPAPIGLAPPITSDPPFHQIARKLILPAFAPRPINALEPQIRALCNALLDEVVGEEFECADRRRSIFLLKRAEDREREFVPIDRRHHVERLTVALARAWFDRHLVRDRDKRRSGQRASGLDLAARIGIADVRDQRNAALRDARLIARDRGRRIAEYLGVIERDIRDDGDARLQDVRAVEASADPGFDHRRVDLGAGERDEREREQHFVI